MIVLDIILPQLDGWDLLAAVKADPDVADIPVIIVSMLDERGKGFALGLDYGLTHSCYDPDAQGRPCGRCDSCTLRAAGFAQAGVADPILGR